MSTHGSSTRGGGGASARPRPKRPARPRRQARTARVLSHGTSSTTSSIADAIVVKQGDLFFLSMRDGRVPFGDGHGFGLYYHDCRFLDGYELRVGDAWPSALAATASRGYEALLELTNPDLHTPNGALVAKETIALTWERVVDGDALALRDRLTFENFARDPVELTVSLRFEARFQDIFVVRGMSPRRTGTAEPPAWTHGALSFVYDGVDGLYRSVSVHFDPAPSATDAQSARFQLHLASHEPVVLSVTVAIAESPERHAVEPHHVDGSAATTSLDAVRGALGRRAKQWAERHATFESDSTVLDRLVGRSLGDLDMLRTQLGGDEFFAAGVPWFVTLFGRDSIIASLQTLMFDATIAEQTLRALARYQGTHDDAWTEEEPGRIPHELRVGELARAGEVPYTPYYGTIDATPLWLILLGEHATWTGSARLFDELRDNVERALAWMDGPGDPDHDGYLEYRSTSKDGLTNQGWKDSGDAISNADGSLATPPIALVEVQGYAWLARQHMARLFRRAGDGARADTLEHQADALQAQFERDFWMPDRGCYALALERDKRQAAVIASNPGQALWTGIANADRARRTVERLMQSDMFSGWGIRTLATSEVRYNPIGYHLGTVWPHDTSIIAAGFRRYGYDEPVQRIFSAIADAAVRFEHDRLPELFAGIPRAAFGVPVRYPVADHPQAWAAGAIPLLLQALLGLVPDGFAHRLHVVRPLLPDHANRIVLRGIRVGDATVDLRIERTSDGTAVDVLRTDGTLEVVVEPATSPAGRASSDRAK